jgi:hypothetical protein
MRDDCHDSPFSDSGRLVAYCRKRMVSLNPCTRSLEANDLPSELNKLSRELVLGGLVNNLHAPIGAFLDAKRRLDAQRLRKSGASIGTHPARREGDADQPFVPEIELRCGEMDGSLGDAIAEPGASELSALRKAGDARPDKDHVRTLVILGLL